MKNYLEPKSMTEVRKWKEHAGKKIEKLGFAEAGRRASEKMDRLIAEESSKKRRRLQHA
jgi:hypothetical protein